MEETINYPIVPLWKAVEWLCSVSMSYLSWGYFGCSLKAVGDLEGSGVADTAVAWPWPSSDQKQLSLEECRCCGFEKSDRPSNIPKATNLLSQQLAVTSPQKTAGYISSNPVFINLVNTSSPLTILDIQWWQLFVLSCNRCVLHSLPHLPLFLWDSSILPRDFAWPVHQWGRNHLLEEDLPTLWRWSPSFFLPSFL